MGEQRRPKEEEEQDQEQEEKEKGAGGGSATASDPLETDNIVCLTASPSALSCTGPERSHNLLRVRYSVQWRRSILRFFGRAWQWILGDYFPLDQI